MQNSAVESHLPLKESGKDVATKSVASKLQTAAARPPIKRQTKVTLVNKNKDKPVTCLEPATSITSLTSRRTDVETEATPKTIGRFIRPRLNRLTEQRIHRLRRSQTDADNAGHKGAKDCRSPSLTSNSVCSDLELTGTDAFPEPLLKLQKRLENMQSEFMQKVSCFRERGFNCAYKLVAIMHEDGLPTNLPVQSVNDLKQLCHNVFKDGFTIIFEQITAVQMAKDEATAAAQREDLLSKLKNELNNKLVAVDNELGQLCSHAGKDERCGLRRQICDLKEVNSQLKSANAKLDAGLVDLRKSRDELRGLLEASRKRSKDLALELAKANISVVEQGNAIDDLQNEIKQMKETNRSLQQRLDENEGNLESSRLAISQHVERVEDLATQLQQAQSDREHLKTRAEELTLMLADRDHLIAEQTRQLSEMGQDKECQSETSNELDMAHTRELQAEQANHEQEEQKLREELEQKQEALRKAELKMARLEEQIEHHRQVLAVRGERINSLDQEMKQREQESNRKINDIMAQVSDKNSFITQITNELASTNEQFQNLCATLSLKQTKLTSQEHAIKLLEESNARSVKLHTKLGEKNALLKDELDHLRRTVNNLMVGSDVSDVDVAGME